MLIDFQQAKSSRHPRNAQKTRERILHAARQEFAKNGLSGARVDQIAERAAANKQLIYLHFGSKDGLFRSVLEEAYARFSAAQICKIADKATPCAALQAIVRNIWNFYQTEPDFLVFLNEENLHRAVHLKTSDAAKRHGKRAVEQLSAVLAEGIKSGDFKEVDPCLMYLTIESLCFHHFSNRYANEFILGVAPSDEARIEVVLQIVMALAAGGPVPSGPKKTSI